MKSKNEKLLLTVKDLMKVMGYTNYDASCRKHKAIRDSIKLGKKHLTVKEFCEAMDLPLEAVIESLRNKPL